MAEVNRISMFKDASGNRNPALIDSQRRPINILAPVELKPGTTGAVGAGAEFTVVNYTVPAGKTFYLTGFDAGGTADGLFKLYSDSTQQLEKRNSASKRDIEKKFHAGVAYAEGTVVSLKVEHWESSSQTFFGTLEGYEV